MHTDIRTIRAAIEAEGWSIVDGGYIPGFPKELVQIDAWRKEVVSQERARLWIPCRERRSRITAAFAVALGHIKRNVAHILMGPLDPEHYLAAIEFAVPLLLPLQELNSHPLAQVWKGHCSRRRRRRCLRQLARTFQVSREVMLRALTCAPSRPDFLSEPTPDCESAVKTKEVNSMRTYGRTYKPRPRLESGASSSWPGDGLAELLRLTQDAKAQAQVAQQRLDELQAHCQRTQEAVSQGRLGLETLQRTLAELEAMAASTLSPVEASDVRN